MHVIVICILALVMKTRMLTSQSSEVVFNYTKTFIEKRELKKKEIMKEKKKGVLKHIFNCSLIIKKEDRYHKPKNHKTFAYLYQISIHTIHV